MEMYIADLLKAHLETNNLLYPLQSGFRQGHSTQSLLLKLTDSWYKSLDNGDLVGVVFLDISKAFDTINHELLLCKLRARFCLSPSLCQLLRSYLNQRNQVVLSNGSFSVSGDILSGVPQGSILGPILFFMFINDLPAVASSSVTTALFADDSTFSVPGKDVAQIQTQMNLTLSAVKSWMSQNCLEVNRLKTKCMLIHSSRRSPPPLNIVFDGSPIEQVSTFKLLGVIVDDNLKWSYHIDYILKSISSNLSLLRRISRYLPRKALTTFYFSKIASYFNYCSLVWSTCSAMDANRLQLAQNYAARIILKLPKFSSATEARAQLGWHSLEEVRNIFLRRLLQSIKDKSATPYLCALMKPIATCHVYTTRASSTECFYLNKIRTNFGKFAISYRLSKLSFS